MAVIIKMKNKTKIHTSVPNVTHNGVTPQSLETGTTYTDKKSGVHFMVHQIVTGEHIEPEYDCYEV